MMIVMDSLSLSISPSSSSSAWIRSPNPYPSLRGCRPSLVATRASSLRFPLSLHQLVRPSRPSLPLGLSSSFTTCCRCYYPFRFPQFSRQQNRKKRGRGVAVWARETVESTGYAEVDAYDEEEEEQSRSSNNYSADLEDQLYDFMITSANPNSFPTKKDLIAAGRTDLVQAISNRGGWLALGWDVDGSHSGTHAQQLGGSGGHEGGDSSTSSTLEQQQHQEFGDDRASSSFDASSSGRSMETDNIEEDAGIQGILCRLGKERSLAYGFASTEKEPNGKHSRGISHQGGTAGHLVGTGEKDCGSVSIDPGEELSYDFTGAHSKRGAFGGKRNTLALQDFQIPELPFTELEATENISSGNQKWIDLNSSSRVSLKDAMHSRSANGAVTVRQDAESVPEKKCPNEIQLRLQRLESKLKTTLSLLRSKNVVVSPETEEESLKQYHELSDAWEFQQTEITKAQDKLRSVKAKLAVVEGKMALDIAEAQKELEDKQKKIDAAQKTLLLLRTACIVWPNTASEVLLSGSFDGWTSQRKMARSSAGVFSLYLKLYPGQYEIKFIVDGVWRVDPLRPIVNNNGHENNVLVIT